MNKDLTVGSPDKVLRNFCIPLFGSVIFQQLYNIADSFVAGKFINENALAAVGNSYEITLIFLAFAFGCNIGCSVIVSKLFGQKAYARLKTAVKTSMIASAVICLILMLTGLFLGGYLLELINTPSDVFDDSRLYLDIYSLGLPFVFFYNISTGIFSALGDSKTPFWFLAASSTSNIAVDILFVKTFDMGVAGVAWATFICQGVSCILSVIFVFLRLNRIKCEEKSAVFSWTLFRDIAFIAVPSILQQSFISFGNIIIQGIINGFGPGVMAGYSASIKLNNLVITSFTTLGNGVSNFTAQNMGAGKNDRVRAGFKAGIKLVWMVCIPILILYMSATGTLIRIFMDTPSKDALNSGTLLLRIVSPFYLVISVKLIADGILRGAGKMKQFMIATFTDLILRVILAAILSIPLGSTGIWCAWPIGWTVGTALSVFLYRQFTSSFPLKCQNDNCKL